MILSRNFLIITLLLGLFSYSFAQENEISYSRKYNDSILFEAEDKLIDKALDLLNNGDNEKAYRQALKFTKTFKSDRGLYNAYSILSGYYRKKGVIDSSNYYVHMSLRHNVSENDSLRKRGDLIAFNTLAINYNTQGLYDTAKKWYLQGIESSKDFGDRYFYYLFLHGLGNLYADNEEYQKAIPCFEECLNHAKDSQIVLGSSINLGNIYSIFEDYKKSNEFLQQAKKLNAELNIPGATVVILINLAENYMSQNEQDKGIGLLLEAMQISDQNGLKVESLESRMTLGNTYLDQGNLTQAKLIFSDASFKAIELGYFDKQLICFEKLQYISIQQGDYKNAYNFAQHYSTVKDSIEKLQKNKELQELEVKFQTAQKEKEIQLLKTEKINRELDLKNQKEEIKNLVLQQKISEKESENKTLQYQNASQKRLNEIALLKKDQEIQQERLKNQVTKNSRQKSINRIILYAFIALLTPITALLITYYQKVKAQKELHKKQDEINRQNIQALLKNKELEIIKTSVNIQDQERKRIAQELHDSIGGNLAAIKLQLNGFSKKDALHQLKTINTQLDTTYEQVRNLSHNLMPKKISYNKFCDVVEEYVTNIGEASTIQTYFNGYPRKEIDNLCPKLKDTVFKIIQELTINTVKHAYASSIELQVTLVEDVLNILYEDNGIGFDKNLTKDGIGLRNIKNRLNEYKGSLDVDSRVNRGSIFNIEIPNTHKLAKTMTGT